MGSILRLRRPEGLLAQFRAELDYAKAMGARYVVFHVSDVSPEETLTYRRLHSDETVIDASAELLNLLFKGSEYSFELLLENLWWPGFSMTSPAMTARLLAAVQYDKTGILLDIGHLFNANPTLSDEAACLAFAPCYAGCAWQPLPSHSRHAPARRSNGVHCAGNAGLAPHACGGFSRPLRRCL